MRIETTNKVKPGLRFSEFRESGEWEFCPIGIKVDSISGYPFPSSDISEDESGVPLLRGINITEGYIRHGKEIDRYFLGNLHGLKKYEVQPGDLVIAMDGSKVGKNSAIISDSDSGALLVQRIARLRCAEKEMIQFIFQHVHSTIFHTYVDRVNTSSGIPHISMNQIENFNIYFPPTNEELSKISNCLSSLDDLIAAHKEKLEALKAHKKGLMQQLFPAEGELVPRLRFEEFRGSGEWEIKAIGNIAENLDYKRIPITGSVREKGDVPYYGASGIIDYVKDFIYDEELLCISEDGANLIDRTYPIAFPISGKTWVNNHAHVLKFENKFTQVIVENYMNSISLEDFLTGVAQPKLNRSKLDNILIPLPSPNEQQKIAECLSYLDEIITAQTEKIEALHMHKNGLMQGLFPVIAV